MTDAINARADLCRHVAEKMATHHFNPTGEPEPDPIAVAVELALYGVSPAQLRWTLTEAGAVSLADVTVDEAQRAVWEKFEAYIERQAQRLLKLEEMDWDIPDEERIRRGKIIAAIEEQINLFDLVRTNIVRLETAHQRQRQELTDENTRLRQLLYQSRTADRKWGLETMDRAYQWKAQQNNQSHVISD